MKTVPRPSRVCYCLFLVQVWAGTVRKSQRKALCLSSQCIVNQTEGEKLQKHLMHLSEGRYIRPPANTAHSGRLAAAPESRSWSLSHHTSVTSFSLTEVCTDVTAPSQKVLLGPAAVRSDAVAVYLSQHHLPARYLSGCTAGFLFLRICCHWTRGVSPVVYW